MKTSITKDELECLELSPREMNIAKHLAWGYTQKEIANSLHISVLTVNTHLKNIYRQLNIHKETDLCRWFLFKEYSIDDNPFKKVLAMFFLLISISMVLTEESTVRVFRSTPMRESVRAARPIREKKYKNVFELVTA